MNLYCLFKGHKPSTTRVVSNNLKEVKCLRCGTKFKFEMLTNTLTKLTKSMKATHDIMAEEYNKEWNQRTNKTTN